MAKRYVTPLLVSLSVVVWLAASLYLTEVSVQYDDAVLSNSYYFWFYAPAALIAGCLNSGKAAPRKPSRAGDVLIFFVFTGLAFLLFYQPGGMRRLPYLLYVWWLALLLLLLLLAALYRHLSLIHIFLPDTKKETPQGVSSFSWRYHPESNWGSGSCSPTPYRLAMVPFQYKDCNGAADEARTRYLHLGKVALYQMSYSRI